MDVKLYEEIIDTYEELTNPDGNTPPEILFTMIADHCNCDFDTVCEAIAAYSGREPLLQMYAEYDNSLSVTISPNIGDIINNEDVADDNNGIAYYGIVALAHGISRLAAHLYKEQHDIDTILEHIKKSLQTGFNEIEHPIEISMRPRPDDRKNDSAGKLLQFPSKTNKQGE